jgi:peptidoglycan hydrolase FlgJ
MSTIGPVGTGATPAGVTADQDARLREVAARLEGVFMEQLLKTMRATVDSQEMGTGSLGEELFTGLMDQTIADSAAARSDRGLGAAVYRQLKAQIKA